MSRWTEHVASVPYLLSRDKAESRLESILKEIEDLDVREAVLVAQDLASYGSDMGERGSIVSLVEAATKIVDRVRLCICTHLICRTSS